MLKIKYKIWFDGSEEYLSKIQEIWDRAPTAERDKFLLQRNKKFAEGEQKVKRENYNAIKS